MKSEANECVVDEDPPDETLMYIYINVQTKLGFHS